MKKLIYIAIICLASQSAIAQQDATFTHYTFNQLSINPAYAGTEDAISITALHRSQWVSFEGAPNTQVLSGHMPIKDKNFGVGLSINHDKIGPSRNLGVAGDFSYKLKLDNKSTLALGLKAAANFVSVGLTDLTIIDNSDASFSENISSDILPNFGFGAYYYTKKYYAGISIPKLLQNGFDADNPTTGSIAISNTKRHYYLLGGIEFNLSKDLKIEPSTFIKVAVGAPIQIDLTARFIYQKRFWAGPTFRLGDAFGLLIGMEVIENLEFGYSFDFSYTNTTFNYNNGSHEIMLRYQIPTRNKAQEKFN